MGRLPHGSTRADRRTRCPGRPDISRRLPHVKRFRPHVCGSAHLAPLGDAGSRMERALHGKPAGSPNGKRIFPDQLTLGGRKRFLRVHRTVLRIDRAGLSRKVRNGPIPLSAAARRTPLGKSVWPAPPKPGWRHLRPGRNLPPGGRSGHARDEMTEVLLSDRTGGASGDGGCSIMF